MRYFIIPIFLIIAAVITWAPVPQITHNGLAAVVFATAAAIILAIVSGEK